MWNKARAKPQYVDLSLALWSDDAGRGGGLLRRLRPKLLAGAGVLAVSLLILAVWGGQW